MYQFMKCYTRYNMVTNVKHATAVETPTQCLKIFSMASRLAMQVSAEKSHST